MSTPDAPTAPDTPTAPETPPAPHAPVPAQRQARTRTATAAPTASSRSAFWRRVGDEGPGEGVRVSGRGGLGAATRAAWARGDAAVAFRRNRELADVMGRFRSFTLAGTGYVAKVLSPRAAAAERARAQEVDRRLRRGGLPLAAPVPDLVEIDADHAALVLPDLGRTLAEDPSTPPDAEAVRDLLDGLLAAGVVWRGFAPRNICAAAPGQGYTLLDLECTEFLDTGGGDRRPVDALTVQFWALEWCPPGGDPAEAEARFLDVVRRHGLTTAHGPADAYEERFADLLGLPVTAAKQHCREVTVAAWRPLNTRLWNGRCFTASEVCQLLDELLPVEHAILATHTLAVLRGDLGEDGYARLLDRLEHAVAAALAAAGAAARVRLDAARVRAAVDAATAALLVRSLRPGRPGTPAEAPLPAAPDTAPDTARNAAPDPRATPGADDWTTLARLARSRDDSRRRDGHGVV